MSLKQNIKSQLSKLKFYFGLSFTFAEDYDPSEVIPEGYKAVFLLQSDLELAWAWQYAKKFKQPLEEALIKAQEERQNVPLILNIADQYNIPITWLTVGHLFLDSCICENGKPHADIFRLNHFSNDFWSFDEGDWFQQDPCTSYKLDPEWYCPDLIKLIQSTKTTHEIGCHTFSHIDCRDQVCSDKVFMAELDACKIAAGKYGIELKSFVHPAHTIGNLDNLVEKGYTSYRTDEGYYIGPPVHYKNQLWELKATLPLFYRKQWSYKYHLYRYKKTLEKVMEHGAICVMWFHPSEDQSFIRNVFPELFEFVSRNKEDIWVTTTNKYINWLNNNNT